MKDECSLRSRFKSILCSESTIKDFVCFVFVGRIQPSSLFEHATMPKISNEIYQDSNKFGASLFSRNNQPFVEKLLLLLEIDKFLLWLVDRKRMSSCEFFFSFSLKRNNNPRVQSIHKINYNIRVFSADKLLLAHKLALL